MLEIRVRPTQSAYFAGQEFRATITLSNICAPPPHSREWREKHQRARRPSNQSSLPSAHARKTSLSISALTTPGPSSPSSPEGSRATLPSIAEDAVATATSAHRRKLSQVGSPVKSRPSRPSLDVSRTMPPSSSSSTHILWSHCRLQGHLIPSPAHIPPDPLMPLRSSILQRPLGSGSLLPTTNPSSLLPRFNFSLSDSTAPSLTGSLFGLAKGLVYGSDGGTLESSRHHAWTTKHLPVFETVRSLVTPVDLELQPGESHSWTYAIIVPAHLPPTLRGTAMRFSYEFSLALALMVDGKQQVKEVQVPVTIWPYTAIPAAGFEACYDVLEPVVQRTDKGRVTDGGGVAGEIKSGGSSGTRASFDRHVAALLAGEHPPTSSSEDDAGPPIDTRFDSAVTTLLHEANQAASFEMAKDGQTFATAHLARTRYAVGESIVGKLEKSTPSGFRIGRFAASLVMHESVPDALLPVDELPNHHGKFSRTIDEHATIAIAFDAFTFDLVVPTDATPTFRYSAGRLEPTKTPRFGGVSWSLKLRFLVFCEDARVLAHDHDDSEHLYAASYLAVEDAGETVEASIPLDIIPAACSKPPNDHVYTM